MNKRTITSFAATLLVLFPILVHAQDTTMSVGLIGGANLNMHSANFQMLPGVPNCCPRFESGSGIAPNVMGLARLPISRLWSVQVTAGYSSLSADLKSNESIPIALDDALGSALVEHSVNASIGMLSIEPSLRFALLPNLGIFAGPVAGYMLSNSYSQKETLVQPSDVGAFENGSRVRNQSSGSTPGIEQVQLGGGFGAGYRMPLNALATLHLEPSVRYNYYYTPLVQNMTWRAASVEASVGITYSLPAPEPPPVIAVIAPPPPTPKAPEPKIAFDLNFVPVDKSGNEVPLSKVRIDDYTRTQLIPLLTYVFFDQNSSTLPSRYRQLSDISNFHLSPDSDAISLYHSMIDVIGQRLKENPSSTVTLTGCDMGPGRETPADLSKSRALTVRDYLHRVWGIADSRMKVVARSLPQTPSNPTDPDGAAENRRVEIRSNDYEIVQPIILRDTIRVAAPILLRAKTTTVAEAGMKQRQTTAEMNQTNVPLPAASNPDERLIPLSSLVDYLSNASSDTISLKANITDNLGRTISREGAIPIIHQTLQRKKELGSSDTAFSRYNLILFDFDRDNLSDANAQTMELIKSRINPGSRVKILGFADRTGEKGHNKQLSMQRALSASKYLNTPNTEVQGIGSEQLQFNNDTPEGRFYSRTVTINVTSVDAPEYTK